MNRRKSRDTGAEMPGAPAPPPRLVLRVSAPLLFPRSLSFYNALESQEVSQQISQTLGRGGWTLRSITVGRSEAQVSGPWSGKGGGSVLQG